MHIIKAAEKIDVAHPVFLIFGQPGIGKTSLAYSTKDPLLLDFDQGAHRSVNRKDTLSIGTWADVGELMTAPQTLAPYQTIVVDTVGRCLDVLTADIVLQHPKLAPNGNLSQQGWGQLKTRFRTWMSALRALGHDVLLVAHDKEDKDGDLRIVRPDIVGGSFAEVLKIADFVGYLSMSGKDRILDFNPTDRWIGKNPAQWAPFKIPPVAKAQTFLAELFDQGRAALGKISEQSAVVATDAEEWRAYIHSLTTAEEYTAEIPDIKELPKILQAQVAKMLIDDAAAKGFPFNKQTKVFMTATPEVTVFG